MTTEYRALGAVADDTDHDGFADAPDLRRCWGCRNLWPRASMRWGAVTEGPLWYPRAIRVLRCPDCLT